MTIQTKLKSTVKCNDHLPGTWEVLVNPDGPEAAAYIDNMIHHMGHVIKLALQHADESTANLIKKHAHAAIKGVQNV
jgi:hypothetical protein